VAPSRVPAGEPGGTRFAASVRMTARSRRVLAYLAGREAPLTAQQLYAELHAAGERISQTTVYRALHKLADAGLVHRFPRAAESAYRACAPDPHDHFLCAGCGLVQEHRLAGLADSLAQLQREGIQVTSYQIEVHGFCSRCA
jgi:Fur family transcriptional regulator, ferric uptake regulator